MMTVVIWVSELMLIIILLMCCADSDEVDDVGSRSNMRSIPGQTDLDDDSASQRTSGELSSPRRNDSPQLASDDQRSLMYIIPAIVAGLVLIVAGAVAVMCLWKRRQQRRNLGNNSFSILWLLPSICRLAGKMRRPPPLIRVLE